MRTLRPDDQVVLDATMNTWAIADVRRESGARVVSSNPLCTRASAEAKVKTDKVDALNARAAARRRLRARGLGARRRDPALAA